MHLEIVEDLTTEGSLTDLSRFIDRRGTCENLYSDNGTNFVGAISQLKEFYSLLHTESSSNRIQRHAADEGI